MRKSLAGYSGITRRYNNDAYVRIRAVADGDGQALEAGGFREEQLEDMALDLATPAGAAGNFNPQLFRHVVIMYGCAVGGGSNTHANTLMVPGDKMLGKALVVGAVGLESEMPRHYAEASRILGVIDNGIVGPGRTFPTAARPTRWPSRARSTKRE